MRGDLPLFPTLFRSSKNDFSFDTGERDCIRGTRDFVSPCLCGSIEEHRRFGRVAKAIEALYRVLNIDPTADLKVPMIQAISGLFCFPSPLPGPGGPPRAVRRTDVLSQKNRAPDPDGPPEGRTTGAPDRTSRDCLKGPHLLGASLRNPGLPAEEAPDRISGAPVSRGTPPAPCTDISCVLSHASF